jgi:hypothetical protein
MFPKRILAVLAILVLGLMSGQCGKDEGPTQTPPDNKDPVDTIPPAAVSNLLAKNPSVNSMNLVWTAPGDDGMEGTAASYDIRYHNEQITDFNWNDAIQFDKEPPPKSSGYPEAVVINDLDEISTYFFAVKTTDDAGNTSGLSNPTSETTLNESMPPMPVTDLGAVAVSEYSFLLTWTAPGDDGIVGTASEYDIRYSQQPITVESWATATKVMQLPSPKSGGEPESLLVSQLRAPANHYFAMMAADEVPNWSEISNIAFGMGFNVELMLLTNYVQMGEELRILFRAPGGKLVTMNLNRYGIMGCDPTHVWVQDCIIPSVRYPEGIHEISYDFKKNDGSYLPRAAYYVVLCWDWEIQSTGVVYFEDPP